MENQNQDQNQDQNPKLSIEEIKAIADGLGQRQFTAADIVNAYVEGKGALFSDVDMGKLKDVIGRRIRADIKENKGHGLFRKGKNKKGKEVPGVFVPVRVVPSPPPAPPRKDSLYLGKSGEYSVMSELLLRGFNANGMTVDDGIDIVASKNNVIYYYQVKTTRLDESGRAKLSAIKRRSYDAYIQSNTRYVACVLVAGRYGCDERIYVVFSNADIDRLRHGKCVKDDGNEIRIKLRFDSDRIYAYDDKEEEVTYYRNRF